MAEFLGKKSKTVTQRGRRRSLEPLLAAMVTGAPRTGKGINAKNPRKISAKAPLPSNELR
jgi:hypothetical protein